MDGKTRKRLIGTEQFKQRYLPLEGIELPSAGVLHLWFVDLRRLGSPLMLDVDGVEDPVLRPRHERTIRRFYLRLLLGAYLGISGKDVMISRMVKGKPVLDPNVHRQRLDFSSAGSNGCCLIGVSTSGQVGVDLEEEGRMAGSPRALVRRYFSDRENERFGKMGAEILDRAFLHTWACKEAVVKAAGLGIANQLCRFTVNTNPDQAAAMLEIEDGDVAPWRLAMVKPANGFIGSVALKSDASLDKSVLGEQLHIDGFSLNRRPA